MKWLYFFALINLVQDKQNIHGNLVQDYIFTSCTRLDIIQLQGQAIQTTTKQPGKPKAPINLKQYTCERYRDVRGNSQEDSLRVANNQIRKER